MGRAGEGGSGMNKKYIVRLSDEERVALTGLAGKGMAAARKLTHARVLLKADADGPAWTDERIAEAFDLGRRTVENLRQRFVEEGLDRALNRKKRCRPPREKILDGEKEAQLIVLACSAPPEGRARWTLRLLASKLVELAVVESISYETVRQAMKKTS